MDRRAPFAFGLAALFALAGCATSGAPNAADPGAGGTDPATGPLLRSAWPATVLDDGEGPELCLGGIDASYPPQCGGPALIGWDWESLELPYEEASGVRWGTFGVVGTYDPGAQEFTVTEVIGPDDVEVVEPDTDPWRTPCPEPAGGWVVTDGSRASHADLDAAISTASALPDLSQVWVDQSPNPARSAEPGSDPLELERAMNDPRYTILNVAVTDDAAGAETAIREVWSGMLCVSEGVATERELQGIVEELFATRTDLLQGGVDAVAGTVNITVLYDDGAIQAEVDAAHGPGVVVVSSALLPA